MSGFPTVRRYARDMEGAFGPYHRSSQCHIEPMADARAHQDKYLYIVSAAALAVVALVCIFN